MKNAWTCDVLNIIASWVQLNPNLTIHNLSTYKHTSKCIKHCEDANGMQCVIILHQKRNTQPKNFTKYSSIFKNPKIFKKTQNLGLNVWNACKMKDLEHLQSDLTLDKAKNLVGKEFWERKECLGSENTVSIESEWEKWNLISRWTI